MKSNNEKTENRKPEKETPKNKKPEKGIPGDYDDPEVLDDDKNLDYETQPNPEKK